jgi:hypothetical protein
MFIKEHQQLLEKYKKEHKDTEAEIKFELVLNHLKLNYRKQKRISK